MAWPQLGSKKKEPGEAGAMGFILSCLQQTLFCGVSADWGVLIMKYDAC